MSVGGPPFARGKKGLPPQNPPFGLGPSEGSCSGISCGRRSLFLFRVKGMAVSPCPVLSGSFSKIRIPGHRAIPQDDCFSPLLSASRGPVMYRQPLRLLTVLCLLGIASAFAAQVSAGSGPIPSTVISVAAMTGPARQPSSSVRPSPVPPSGNGRAIPHARATTTSAASTACVPKAGTACPGPASSGTAPGVRAVTTEDARPQASRAGLRSPGAPPCPERASPQ